MDIPTLANVQILLLSCLLDDLCDVPGPAPVQSIARARAARAVRLALDLGLDASDEERDKRIWRCVVIMDTWCVRLMKGADQTGYPHRSERELLLYPALTDYNPGAPK